jgi:hypothetical protein
MEIVTTKKRRVDPTYSFAQLAGVVEEGKKYPQKYKKLLNLIF